MKALNINLLPIEKRKKEQSTLINWPLLGAIVFIFVAILGFAFIYLSTSVELATKKNEKQQLSEEITKLNSQLQEVARLEAQKAELDRANEVLVALVKRKVSFSRVLDELGKSTPPKLWVTTMGIDGAGNVKIGGYALDNEQKQVAALLLNMQNNKMFTDVQLVFSKASKISSKDVIQFEVVAKLVYSEATVDIDLPPSLLAAQQAALAATAAAATAKGANATSNLAGKGGGSSGKSNISIGSSDSSGKTLKKASSAAKPQQKNTTTSSKKGGKR